MQHLATALSHITNVVAAAHGDSVTKAGSVNCVMQMIAIYHNKHFVFGNTASIKGLCRELQYSVSM